MAAVPDNAMTQYKNGYRQYTPQTSAWPINYYSYYYPIHLNETLKKFDAKFATNGFFQRRGRDLLDVALSGPGTEQWSLPPITSSALT